MSREVATTAPVAQKTDLDRAIAAADAAFPVWSKTPPSERRAVLNKAADVPMSMNDEFVAASVDEIGCAAPGRLSMSRSPPRICARRRR